MEQKKSDGRVLFLKQIKEYVTGEIGAILSPGGIHVTCGILTDDKGQRHLQISLSNGRNGQRPLDRFVGFIAVFMLDNILVYYRGKKIFGTKNYQDNKTILAIITDLVSDYQAVNG